MSIDTRHRRSALLAVTRAAIGSAALLLVAALGACTTAEGTNALVNPATFEREVMTSTLQGVGMIPQDQQPKADRPRAPLVLPKDTASLPPPGKNADVAALPADSDNVQVNTAGLSDSDLKRLRDARVIDLRNLNGRAMTDTERQELTARMSVANAGSASAKRPLILPPAQYFTNVKGKDLVCLASNGQLVTLADPACPPAIRKALTGGGPTPGQGLTTVDMSHVDLNEDSGKVQ